MGQEGAMKGPSKAVCALCGLSVKGEVPHLRTLVDGIWMRVHAECRPSLSLMLARSAIK
jgi:hypothetical protein